MNAWARVLLVALPAFATNGAGSARGPSDAPRPMRAIDWQGRMALAEVRDGLAIVEGDIVAGRIEEIEARGRTPHPGKPPGSGLAKGHAIGYARFLWPAQPGPAASVPYTVVTPTPAITAAIAAFNAAFTGVIQFVPRAAQADYVEIALDGGDLSGACYSSLGRVGGKQQVGGSIACVQATLLHEFGHAVGLYHEHQRADAAARLDFLPENIDKPLAFDNFVAPTTNATTIGGYDHASIMHYRRNGFSKNELPVFESTIPGIPFGDAQVYSAGDLDQVRRLYGMAPTSVVVTTNPPGLPITVDGTGYTSPQSFAWTLGSQHEVSVQGGYLARDGDTARYAYARWNDGLARVHTVTVAPGDGRRTAPLDRPALTVLQADFVQYDEVQVSTVGNGTVAIEPPLVPISGKSYAVHGSTLDVTASPGSGASFHRWFGNNYAPQGLNPRPWRVIASPWSIQAAFTNSPVVYTVTAAYTNPAPPLSAANPIAYGTVDGQFEYLPQNYTAIDGWSPGTTGRTVEVPDPFIPITFNLQYQFLSWSDGGARAHTLSSLPGTGTVYTATLKPRYRGYSTHYPACATATPPVADALYADGTVVGFSVTPVAGWTFTGWTDALAGMPSPTSLTVHDQFAVVATFNTVAAPLAITAFSLASAPLGGASVPLTITGTGFTPTTQVFVDGVFHASTFVDSTRVDTVLASGDLDNLGGIGVGVFNYTNSPACTLYVERSLEVVQSPSSAPSIFSDGFE